MDQTAKLQLEIRRVRNRCKELEDFEEKYNALIGKNKLSVDEIKVLKDENQNLEKTIEKLKTENPELIELRVALEDELKCRNDDLEKLKIQSENSKDEIVRLKRENSELNDCLANADLEVQNQLKENEKITTENLKFKELIAEFKIKIEEKDEEIHNLNEKVAEGHNQDDVVKLMLQNKTFRIDVKKLKDQLILVLKENEELQNNNSEYETRVNELQLNLEAANNNNTEFEAKNKLNEECVEELKKKLMELEDASTALNEEKQELVQFKCALEENFDDIMTKHEKLEKQHKELTNQLIGSLKERDEAKEQLKAIEIGLNSSTDVEDKMRMALIVINSASRKLLEEYHEIKLKIDEKMLKMDLDNLEKY